MLRATLFLISSLLSIHASAAVTESEYNFTLSDLQTRLHPWVLEHYQADLLVTGDWPKDYTPTSAGGSFYKPNGKWGVHVVGWVARRPEIDADALRLVYCHELGHHIYGGGGEVESDYFATSLCAPEAYPAAVSTQPVPDKLAADCRPAENPAFCARVLAAADRANEFRAYVWRLRNVFNEEEIAEAVACRRQVFLDGLLGQPMTDCRF